MVREVEASAWSGTASRFILDLYTLDHTSRLSLGGGGLAPVCCEPEAYFKSPTLRVEIFE